MPLRLGHKALTGTLGSERFAEEEAGKELPLGVAPGLAWTPTGGDILYVEAIDLPQVVSSR